MNALRTTVVRTSSRVTHRVQKRQMASGAAPQWTGIDKVIRDKFPEDYQGKQIYVRRVAKGMQLPMQIFQIFSKEIHLIRFCQVIYISEERELTLVMGPFCNHLCLK